jgi:tetratricopeptide (TPR) repeat protein
MMNKTLLRGSRALLAALLFFAGPLLFAAGTDDPQLSLMDQMAKFNKEKSEYLQQYVLDRVLGPGKGIVIVDVEMGIETKTTRQEAKEKKAERKQKLGEIDYLLPGVPNPKSVTQQDSPPGESKEESGQASQTKVEVRNVIKRLIVTVLYDEKVTQDKLDAVKEAIMASMKLDMKRGDKIEMKKTRFTRGLEEELLRPQYLIPIAFALLLLFFLFGPLASFLRSYIRTIRERGGNDVTIDSSVSGALNNPGGEQGALEEGKLAEGGAAGGKEEEDEKAKYHPFSYINDENLKRLVYLVRKESPQTIALVVSYLKPEYVREVLNALTPELQAQVALEMATIRSMTQEDVQKEDNYIKEKIEFLIGGIPHLLDTLDQVDRPTQLNILEYLQNEKPDLYEKVRKHVIMFEDIPTFPDQAMQVIIRELKGQELARALRNAPSEIADKFFSNMSANARAILKEEMEYGKPLTEAEIEAERKKILALIKQMEKEEKIFIREKVQADVLEGFDPTSETAVPEGYAEYLAAGTQYYEAGQYEDALSYLEYCAQTNPQDATAFQYLGNTYYALGRQEEAMRSYERALELNPGDEGLRAWLTEQGLNVSANQ